MSDITWESGAAGRRVPADWSALTNAFYNSAEGVRHYLHLRTGAVVRLVDELADAGVRALITADPEFVPIDAIDACEEYRWLEAFVATVDDAELRLLLRQSIQGRGAFRRFKGALVARPEQRRRWRAFRLERIRAAILAWFNARGLTPVGPEQSPPAAAAPAEPRAVDPARQRLQAMADDLPIPDLDALTALAEFLRATRSVAQIP